MLKFRLIVLLRQSVDVGEAVEDFLFDLGVGDNAFVPIVLQGARTDEKPFADFSPCEVDFSSEKRTDVSQLFLSAALSSP